MLDKEYEVMNRETWEQDRRWALNEGYQPKGYITKEVNGKEVRIPTAEVRIVPPKSGSGVVRPERKQPETRLL
jgi:hypothetical protein